MSAAGLSSPELLQGVNAQDVVDALRRRAERLAAAQPIDDDRRIALVIEGGAMRGVLSGAAAVALDQLGLRQAFDEVYATSAGAMNAAYFLSGQADLGITIYYEELASPRFINPWRLWKIMDVDLVFSHVISRSKPLDVDAILAARTRFLVALTVYRTGTARLVDVRRSASPLPQILKAATSIPVLYNRLNPVDGEACFDGGVLNPFPIRDAIERGCTDIVVLLSRPASYVREPTGRAASLAFDLLFAPRNRAVRGLFRDYHALDRRCRDIALGRIAASNGVRIATICTAEGTRIGRSTASAAELWSAAMEHGQRTMRALGFEGREFRLAQPKA